MTMNKDKMMENAEKIKGVMKLGYCYTLSRLQEITAFDTTDLCMAILLLIRDSRVKQFQSEGRVCYMLARI